MTIKLYQCLCENNRMNKESFLQNEIVLGCIARTPINKTNPVIIIENISNLFDIVFDNTNELVYDNINEIGYSDLIDKCNYCYIEEWERYYFIDSITFNNNKIFSISCSLDVLMSFKNKEWKYNPLYITRRTKGNPFIYDNMVQYKFNKKILLNNGETISDTEAITKGYTTFGIPKGSPYTYRSQYCIVIAVANSSQVYIEGGWARDVPDMRENGTGKMKTISPSSSYSYENTTYYVITPEMLEQVCNYVEQNSSVLPRILSVTCLPYLIATNNSTMGNVLNAESYLLFDSEHYMIFPPYKVKVAKYGNNDRFLYRTFEIPEAESYRDFEPHTEAFLYIPYADTIKLNLQSVRGCTLRLYYYVDFNTSNSSYILYNVTRDLIEATGVSQIGYKFNLTASNSEEIRKTQETNLTSFLFGSIASGISLMSGNPQAMISATRGIISNMGQNLVREQSMISKGNASATSSNTGSMLPLEPFITWNIDEPTFESFEHYKHNIGLPFNDYEYIYNITDGEHIIIGDTSDVIMSSDMTSAELELLRNSLASGFYK